MYGQLVLVSIALVGYQASPWDVIGLRARVSVRISQVYDGYQPLKFTREWRKRRVDDLEIFQILQTSIMAQLYDTFTTTNTSFLLVITSCYSDYFKRS